MGICDVIEVLLLGEERVIDNILSMPYFSSQTCSPLSKFIKKNQVFYSFYSKYLLEAIVNEVKICKLNTNLKISILNIK